MSNDPNVQFDASRFYDFVASMDKKTLNKAERDALRKSVRVVATQTRRNLRGRWPGGTSTRHGRRPSEGIVANVQKATTGQLYGQVHIMGNGRSNSRGYLLKFFEMGTDDRFVKVRNRARRGRTVNELKAAHAGWRGRIKPLWFFRDAVSSTRQEVFGDMSDRMEEAVVKQWARSAAKGGVL